MNKYKIIILNGANCEVYNEIITAKNENEALLKLIDFVIINAWDIIKIEEV